jgi:hypothetical protein
MRCGCSASPNKNNGKMINKLQEWRSLRETHGVTYRAARADHSWTILHGAGDLTKAVTLGHPGGPGEGSGLHPPGQRSV